MEVSGTSTAASGSVKTATTASTLSADLNTFLTLLTTQLQNQDPLEPMDTEAFTSQLVEFSAVEQAIATNTRLDQLLDVMRMNEATSALDYIGREVEFEGAVVGLGASGDLEFGYDLPAEAKTVVVKILDAEGVQVRSLAGETSAGKHQLTWNGLDEQGNRAPAGDYTIVVSAADEQGVGVPASTRLKGVVESLEQADGVLKLVIGGLAYPVESILRVGNDAA